MHAVYCINKLAVSLECFHDHLLTLHYVQVKEINDEEVMSRLPAGYYQEDFDPVAATLEVMPNITDVSDTGQLAAEKYLDEMMADRQKQLEIINSRLSHRVIQNYDAFVQGMVQIRQLGYDLQMTAVLCQNGRKNLRKANQDLLSTPITIVSECRKREIYKV